MNIDAQKVQILEEKISTLSREFMELRKQVNRAVNAGQYASQGFVELHRKLNEMSLDYNGIDVRLKTLEEFTQNFETKVSDLIVMEFNGFKKDFKVTLKWHIGILAAIISIIVAIAKVL